MVGDALAVRDENHVVEFEPADLADDVTDCVDGGCHQQDCGEAVEDKLSQNGVLTRGFNSIDSE